MTSRGWRRRYARLVRDLRVSKPGDNEALSRAVADHLGHPIHLVPFALPDQVPCGLLLSTSRAHYVVYDNTTGALHQRQIVAHELGHLLAGHGSQAGLDTDVARLLMPNLDPAVVRTVLGRIPGYGEQAEREAEVIADLLWRHTSFESAAPVAPANLVDRIRQSLAGD